MKLEQINVVPTAFGTPLEVFEHVYQHEVHVSELIDKLVDIAHATGDTRFPFGVLYVNR